MVIRTLSRTPKKNLSLVVAAMVEAKQAASFKIAARLLLHTRVRFGSALTRFYRLLHNPKLDDLKLSRQLLAALAVARDELVIALDWTEWHPPLRMLLASVISGQRALPVFAAAFKKNDLPRSQNTWENNFVKLLIHNLNSLGKSAVFLADRGFRRVSFLKLLLQQKGHHFLVRLMDDVTLEDAHGKRRLQTIPLHPGQALDFGWVKLRKDAAVTVRVVVIWAKGQKDPWWLATNLDLPLHRLASLYDRRMAIEEQIRDSKGCRFGFKLFWTQIQEPDHLARFMMILAFALLLLTAIGHALLKIIPSANFPHPTKGPRLSCLTIASNYGLDLLSPGPFTMKWLLNHLPPPLLRNFDWIAELSNQ